ncbi:hypothetical protein OKA04_23405 [Luteolibacter flavescens]|uniref:Uncharacterized protein n=1 Tax=Luteolibacter flavescens TaxID=1859460 RepID=A0ABT3FWV3_9BACT|nr:hypothetical protein [Luteolibacter flavescens]MCW1887704.1 hypothetical protein [Luteolibacter flavescens]
MSEPAIQVIVRPLVTAVKIAVQDTVIGGGGGQAFAYDAAEGELVTEVDGVTYRVAARIQEPS